MSSNPNIKSISITKGNENSDIFSETMKFFPEKEDVSDSKLIIDAVVNTFFPKWLICRPQILNTLKEKTDDSITVLLRVFLGSISEHPEMVRLKSKDLLWHLTDYRLYMEEEVEGKERLISSISNSLGFLINEAKEYKNKEQKRYDEKRMGKIIRNLSDMQMMWNKNKYIMSLVFTDIIRCFIIDWDYFNNNLTAQSIIVRGLILFRFRYSDYHFYKIYQIMYSLSEENRMLTNNDENPVKS